MGKMAVAGIGIAIVVGGALWLGSSGRTSSSGGSDEPSGTSNYGTPYSSSRPTPQQGYSGAGPQIGPKDIYDGAEKAGEYGWDKYKEHVPQVGHAPKVIVEPPHIRVPPLRP